MNGLGSIGAELGDAVLGPAVRKALLDPSTKQIAQVQIASILESPEVQAAIAPTLRKVAILGFVGVIAGATIANLLTRKI